MHSICRKYVGCLFVLLTGMVSLQAQTYSISGKIRKPDSSLVEGAEVYLKGTAYFTYSSHTGHFVIHHVDPGTFILVISTTDNITLTDTVDVTHKSFYREYTIDTLSHSTEAVEIYGDPDGFGLGHLNDVEGTAIYAGKKTEVVLMNDITANTATNNTRQIYARIAGLNIFENDGGGLQLGIGGRGLNPNRVSNFNTRQNGYDISADALGYPESYYTPPTEALERIEIVRGAASLQYGTQFGGFINFKFRKPPADKKIALLSRQTGGSFGFFNSFNEISGTNKKWSYSTYFQYKRSDGWRPNSTFNLFASHASVTYQANKKLSFTGEYTYQSYLAHQPGGLTDQEFYADPRQTIRNRNWFKVNWNLFALMMDYKFNSNTILNVRTFCLIAGRDALGFLGSIDRVDPLANRDFLSDKYKNFGGEVRLLHHYEIRGKASTVLVGTRYYQGMTIRKEGDASDGNGPDFTYLHPDSLEASNYKFPSRNIALFMENIFYMNSNWSVTPGIRFEYIHTSSDGYYSNISRSNTGAVLYYQQVQEQRSRDRSFVLVGIGTSYIINPSVKAYANISQNYKAINFNDMRVNNPNVKVDQNLRDEKGYTIDMGFRGNVKKVLDYDVSIFMIQYYNRIGTVQQRDLTTYAIYRYRTNISDSRNLGLEAFFEVDFFRLIKGDKAKSRLSWFHNIAMIDAKYLSSQESAYYNKKVEYVPFLNYKTGITYKRSGFRAVCQMAYVSQQFSDATNTTTVVSNALVGTIPAYYVADFSVEYIGKKYGIITGLNNLTNNMYFTRRAEGYPGPGILPSDGRSFFVTLQLKL